MADKSPDARNEEILRTISKKIGDLVEKKRGEAAWEGGVTEEDAQHLVRLAEGLEDPFRGFKVNPIKQVRHWFCAEPRAKSNDPTFAPFFPECCIPHTHLLLQHIFPPAEILGLKRTGT